MLLNTAQEAHTKEDLSFLSQKQIDILNDPVIADDPELRERLIQYAKVFRFVDAMFP